jgi:serine/threonine-protein kinase
MQVATEAREHLSAFGKYRLIASLGQGGMADVYLAVLAGPAGFNKLIVIKALRRDGAGFGPRLDSHASSFGARAASDADEFVHMFLDEARLSARLNHPNIVQTYEVGELEGRLFLAMEYLEGQSLRVAQRKLGPTALPLEEELRIVAKTARALHYAHELKGFNGEALDVVHRDVSPQNVFLTYNGQIKLLDFGIAKADDAAHMTKVGVIRGKLDYIAPEQIRGDAIDRRADVFALGAMTWECVTGRRFAGGSHMQDVAKLQKRLTGGEPRVRELKPEVPDRLVYIVERALCLRPDDRHATAAEFADEVEAFLEQMGMRPSEKSLAERLWLPFREERARLSTLIEQQIRLAQQDQTNALALPSLGRNDLSQSLSGVRSGFARLPDAQLGEDPRVHGLASPAQPHAARWSRALKPLALVGAVALGVALASTTGPDAPGPGPDRKAATPATGTQATAIQAPAIQATASAATTARVKLQITATPKDARATLDGMALPQLPLEAELPKDSVMHQLEFRAQGYASETLLVPFDRDRSVVVSLTRQHELPRRSESLAEARQRQRIPRSTQALAPTPAPAAAREPKHASTQPLEPGPGTRLVEPGTHLTAPRNTARAKIDKVDPYAD